MSDKKTPAGTPSGTAPTSGSFEQEFEKFLRDEATPVGAIYRKLPQAEPDAQLDARVRALAHGALRETSPSAASSPGSSPARGRRGWVPVFASAAVLVLAAGIAWRMGPRNWAEKDVAQSVTVDATTASSANAPAAGASSPSVPHSASQTADPDAARAAAQSVDAAKSDRSSAPQSFPAQPAATGHVAPPASDGTLAGSAQAELRKTEGAQDVGAAAVPRASESAATVREKNAASPDLARVESKKSAPAVAAAPSPKTVAKPAPLELQERMQTPVEAKAARSQPASPPAPPVMTSEATTSQELTTPAPEQAAADTRRRDESAKELARQPPAGNAAQSALAGTMKARAPTPPASPALAPPPPPPPPPSAMDAPAPATTFAPEPQAAPPPKPVASTAARDDEVQKQMPADHFASPAGTPRPNLPGRPTAAQLAAWPAPNCRPRGASTASGSDVPARASNYPPDVPDAAQMRYAIVENFLDLDSRDGALKAYADFRLCYPDDRWPESLLRRLGTR